MLAGMKLKPEEILQWNIVKWLRDMVPQLDVVAPMNELARDERTRVRGTALGMHRGAPDLIVVGPGIDAWIEVKVPGKKPTPDQSRFITKRLSEGRAAAVVWSIEDVRNLLLAHGVRTREHLFGVQQDMLEALL